MKTTDSAQPFSVPEDRKWVISPKLFFGALGVVAVAATSWAIIKTEVSSQGARVQAIEAIVTADHDQLKVQGAILQQQQSMLERIDRKLDRLGERRISIGGGGSSGP